MTSSRFRRRRRTDRKLVLDGDFPDTGESVTEILQRVRPAGYDGTTITFAGASVAGLESGAAYEADPAAGLRQAIELTATGERGDHPADCAVYDLRGLPPGRYQLPAPVREEPAARQVSGKGWSMTVNTGGPGVPWNARLRAAYTFLQLKWAYLEQRGMGYRVDEADQVLRRGEELPAGSVIGEAHREAAAHLMGSGEPWEPAGGWNHGWAAGLPWYDRHPDDQAARP